MKSTPAKVCQGYSNGTYAIWIEPPRGDWVRLLPLYRSINEATMAAQRWGYYPITYIKGKYPEGKEIAS